MVQENVQTLLEESSTNLTCAERPLSETYTNNTDSRPVASGKCDVGWTRLRLASPGISETCGAHNGGHE